jgi:hypothetical protein
MYTASASGGAGRAFMLKSRQKRLFLLLLLILKVGFLNFASVRQSISSINKTSAELYYLAKASNAASTIFNRDLRFLPGTYKCLRI